MESSAYWKKAEVIIDSVLHEDNMMNLGGETFIGTSLAKRIADALRATGQLHDEDEPIQGDEAAYGPKQSEPVKPVGHSDTFPG